MKLKLNAESVAIVNDIIRITGRNDPSFIIDQALKTAATIGSMSEKDQEEITNKLTLYGFKPHNESA